jgi:hypothetical protein
MKRRNRQKDKWILLRRLAIMLEFPNLSENKYGRSKKFGFPVVSGNAPPI